MLVLLDFAISEIVSGKLGLKDMGFIGDLYTCIIKDLFLTIRARLDRALSSSSWSARFPNSAIHHLKCSYSDHNPLKLVFDNGHTPRQHRNRSFKFESMWIRHTDCAKLIVEIWDPESDVLSSLDNCRIGLINWSRRSIGSVKGQIKKTRHRLGELQEATITDDTKLEEKKLKSELEEILERENAMWKQRSKVQWAQEGDRNTRFFHSRASRRLAKNEIRGLKDDQGILQSDQERMGVIAVDYFRGIFTSINPSIEDVEMALEFVVPKVTEELNRELCRAYSAE